MIKFFRHIRKKLLNEGKTSKYLKYAVGEIVLVVIGILIALQINNWNEKRKDQHFEITMLKELKSSLEGDLGFFEAMKVRTSMREEGIQELLEMIASNQTYPDTTLLRSYNKMTQGFIFDFSKGAYEGLKSVGFDKIKNDSLRSELIMIYEGWLPATKSFYEVVVDGDSRNKDYKLELHNALWRRIQIQMPDNSYKIVSRPVDNETFLKQPELIDRIKIEQDNVNFIKSRFNILERTLNDGIEHVTKELNRRLTK